MCQPVGRRNARISSGGTPRAQEAQVLPDGSSSVYCSLMLPGHLEDNCHEDCLGFFEFNDGIFYGV
jgi:hypothetical protein